MATLTPITAAGGTTGPTVQSTWNYSSGSWTHDTSLYYAGERLSDTITSSPATGDNGVGLAAGANTSLTLSGIPLQDVDSDFGTMDTLAINYSTAELPSPDDYVDDTGWITVGIYKSDGTTLIAGQTSTVVEGVEHFDGTDWTSGIYNSGSAPGYDKTVTFNYVNTTATKADWNGALISFSFVDTRSMGTDAATIILVDFQLEGTYTAAVTSDDVTGTETSMSVTTAQATVTGTGELDGTATTVDVTTEQATVVGQGDIVGTATSVSVTTEQATVTAPDEVDGTATTVAVTTAQATVVGQGDIVGTATSLSVSAGSGAVTGSVPVAGVATSLSVSSDVFTVTGTADVSGRVAVRDSAGELIVVNVAVT